jgi:hypothetical protein
MSTANSKKISAEPPNKSASKSIWEGELAYQLCELNKNLANRNELHEKELKEHKKHRKLLESAAKIQEEAWEEKKEQLKKGDGDFLITMILLTAIPVILAIGTIIIRKGKNYEVVDEGSAFQAN